MDYKLKPVKVNERVNFECGCWVDFEKACTPVVQAVHKEHQTEEARDALLTSAYAARGLHS